MQENLALSPSQVSSRQKDTLLSDPGKAANKSKLSLSGTSKKNPALINARKPHQKNQSFVIQVGQQEQTNN
jgi:hypothetical protein